MNLERSRARILEAPLFPAMLAFGLPLAIGMGLQVTFNLVDAYLVSRLSVSEADAALGAIGICDQLAAIGSIISYGYTTAASTFISHAQGRGDLQASQRIARQSTLVILGMGALCALLGLFGSRFLMTSVISAQGPIRELGVEYLRVMITGSVTIFLMLHLTSLMRALGSSKTPVVLLIASNILNFVLAVVLIYGKGPAPAVFGFGPKLAALFGVPRLGLLGAAWATILARLIVLLPLGFLAARKLGLVGQRRAFAFDFALERKLWHLGWPSMTQLVVRIAAMLAVQSLVARTFTSGADQTATVALGVVFRLETMALFVGLGWGSATQTFVGQNLGARNVRRARQSAWLATGLNGLMMLGLSLVYFACAPTIVKFFDQTPGVVTLSEEYLRTVGPSYVGLGIGIVLGSALQAGGRPQLTLLLDLLVLCGLLLPHAFTVAMTEGTLSSVFWAIALAYVAFAVVYGVAFHRTHLHKHVDALELHGTT